MKVLTLFLVTMLMMGFASAAYGDAQVTTDASVQAGSKDSNDTNKSNNGIGAELSGQIATNKAELKEGNYIGPLGQALNVRVLAANLRELRSNGVSAETELNITTEGSNDNTKFKAHLSNGMESEIKVMPDRASETAIAKLSLHACSPENNCTIVLKEVGRGNDVKAAYEVKAKKKMKLLGMFKVDANVSSQVDAETGEVIKTHRPWWAVMSTEVNASA